RFIGNRSSGKMGAALARAAKEAGHEVTLLLGTGAGDVKIEGVRVERFESTADLEKLLQAHWPGHDVLLMAAAVAASLYILVRRVGRTRQAVGEITAVTSHQDGQILGVEVCLKDRWAGHEAGQFAFVTFDAAEGPHPFTISNTWKDDGRLVFLIKGLGDYTRELPTSLKTGSLVTVEGPYGQFNFRGSHERQIWVSAGIGITPFIARMQELAANPDLRDVDLYHATADRDAHAVKQLRRLAASARVRLHVWVAAEQGRLTGTKIMQELPDWRSADIWFCGPVVFGKELRKELTQAGLPASAFHQELFHLR
ncbi:MAG TPA: phosphopantothenoylcysteine decarboxylase, partial [Gemmatimonadaceae bacterium]|nr:phosphopantothenoylcysteine decarboxylase [Gemmatimonadaceae bacterium]